MAMSEHEVAHVEEVFLSREPDADGNRRLTLWDFAGPGRTRAVALSTLDARMEIHTDPEIVAAFLDGDPA